jgi:hypothetical protein
MGGVIRVSRVGDGPLWGIASSYYSPALVDNAKSVPGMRFDGPSRQWQGYVDAVAAVVARLDHVGVSCVGVDSLPAPDAWKTTRTPYMFATQGANGMALREYQIEGVRFLLAQAREGALLADSMRLGKSLQAVVAARAFKAKTLVLCPSHVVGVWSRPKDAPEGPGEIAKWWPDAWKTTTDTPGVVHLETVKPYKSQIILRGFEEKAPKTPDEIATYEAARKEQLAFVAQLEHVQVIVCHYDIVYAWADVLKLWGMATFILDECHILSGYQSRRSDEIKGLRATAKHTIGLTGTPVTNLPKHLHNVLEVLAYNRFGYFFTEHRPGCFARLFCDSKEKTVGVGNDQIVVWDHSGRSNLDEPDGKYALTKAETLHARVAYLMLRRLKKDVDPQLPHKTRQIIDVAIPARMMIGLSHKIFDMGGKDLRNALDLAADGKLKSVVEVAAGHVAEGEKALVFCYRRLFAEQVAAGLSKKVADNALVVFVHGGLAQKERDRRIHKLRMHKGPGVLACTIDTTSTGIDLSFANVAVVGELTWEPHELAQLEERLYKFGSDTKALIQYIIARGTGDELILRAVINKLDTFERVIGDTGDKMKQELAGTKEDAMKRLYAAMVEMQQTPVTKVRRKKIKS